MSEPVDAERAARLLRLATRASVATASLLIAGKLMAWLLTGSVSVLASLVDSLMDVGASLINLMAVSYSLRPPDTEHRFGHGKAESLAGLAQSMFVAGSALFLLFEAVDRLLNPRELTQVTVGVVVMAGAIVATLALLALQRHVIRRTGSTAIRADALHYTTDVLTNGATLVALLLADLGWPGTDPVIAILIGVYILYGAGRIAREAFQALMDRELPDGMRARIVDLASAHPQVRGVHDLRTRKSGRSEIIQLHLELDATLTLARAHAIADAVDAAIRREFPQADVTIHEDPEGVVERRLDTTLSPGGGERGPQGR